MKRVLTALVLVPFLVAIIGYAPPLCFFLLVVAASVLALEEFFSLGTKSGFEVFHAAGHGSSLLLLATLYGSPSKPWSTLLVLVISCLLFLAAGLRRGSRLSTILSG